jgi:hypothetical protein
LGSMCARVCGSIWCGCSTGPSSLDPGSELIQVSVVNSGEVHVVYDPVG